MFIVYVVQTSLLGCHMQRVKFVCFLGHAKYCYLYGLQVIILHEELQQCSCSEEARVKVASVERQEDMGRLEGW